MFFIVSEKKIYPKIKDCLNVTEQPTQNDITIKQITFFLIPSTILLMTVLLIGKFARKKDIVPIDSSINRYLQ